MTTDVSRLNLISAAPIRVERGEVVRDKVRHIGEDTRGIGGRTGGANRATERAASGRWGTDR